MTTVTDHSIRLIEPSKEQMVTINQCSPSKSGSSPLPQPSTTSSIVNVALWCLSFVCLLQVQSASASSISGDLWLPYRCNMSKYLQNDGCHPNPEARCDGQSGLCICLSHFEQQKPIGLLEKEPGSCLKAMALGQSCQHSAQCYFRTLHSGCFRHQIADLWQCACVPGYKRSSNNQCIAQAVQPEKPAKCEQNDGYLWIPMLKRCVASQVRYSMRVGRAGGGRGGGRGGSVGRNTGSRAWFNRNARSHAAPISRLAVTSITHVMAAILVCFLNKLLIMIHCSL